METRNYEKGRGCRMITQEEYDYMNELAHVGVKGMKWGHRKAEGPSLGRRALNSAKRFNDKANIGKEYRKARRHTRSGMKRVLADPSLQKKNSIIYDKKSKNYTLINKKGEKRVLSKKEMNSARRADILKRTAQNVTSEVAFQVGKKYVKQLMADRAAFDPGKALPQLDSWVVGDADWKFVN